MSETPSRLTDFIKDDIRALLKQISDTLPGFRSRPQQRQMIGAVARTLARFREEEEEATGDHILVVEGPTGTGKTLGYLIPALVLARHMDKRLVVATATVALQEQLLQKDLPFLEKHSGIKIRHAIAKGRGRYVCERNLRQLAGEGGLFDHPPGEDELALLFHMARAFPKEWNGERDLWPGEVDEQHWQSVANNVHSCTARRCLYYPRCPFFAARAKLSEVEVIVANHDLVLADLELGGGIILPSPSETFYIFDEAHHLPSKALSHFAANLWLRGANAWLEDLAPSLDRAARFVSGIQAHASAARDEAAELIKRQKECVQNFDREPALIGEDLWRFTNGQPPAWLKKLAEEIVQIADPLLLRLQQTKEALNKGFGEEGGPHQADAERSLSDVGFLHGRMENFTHLWTLMAQEDREGYPPFARWVEARKDANRDYSLHVSPIDAAGLLQGRLFHKAGAVILTSATLTALGEFHLFSSRCGLFAFPETEFLKLESPFNFREQASLHVPTMRSDPKRADEHSEEIAEILPGILHDSLSALVLFASRKQMLKVRELLPETFQQQVQAQGDGARQKILETHEKRVAKGERSVLFGLASFAEGLDLPGELCTHVVIARIPFASPNDPLEEATAEWVESRGKQPFMEISLPEASIRLVQAVGRLIRTETDVGKVTILDPRIVTMRYGRLLLNSLPPMRQELG